MSAIQKVIGSQMRWVSVKEGLPIPVYDEDGSVNSVIVFHKNYPEYAVPYEVWNAEYAMLHSDRYDEWMDFPQKSRNS